MHVRDPAVTRPFVVVGDALLDRDLDGRVERLCPDAPAPVVDDIEVRMRPGGAALAAALLARDTAVEHDIGDVVLVTALGDDDAGRELRALATAAGVDVEDLGQASPTPEKVRIRAGDRPVARLDYGGRGADGIGNLTARAARCVEEARAVLVADYGRGLTAQRSVRETLAHRRSGAPLVWDPHPRGAAPTPGASLVTPNASELATFVDATTTTLAELAAGAESLRREWDARALAVTRGEDGALLATGSAHPLVVPAERCVAGDPCGAGDRFASAALVALGQGALPSEAIVAAVASATAFVAAGGAAAVRFDRGDEHAERETLDGAFGTAASVRARGGTVVATSGCFDLLHAGHVSALRAARALGDWLVVCLNSDDSVRRLKGADRPLVPEHDRAAVLRGLTCVDEVVVFDDDTPARALEALRPHVFVKGGDYGTTSLPEADVLAQWGGQAVIVPYLEGRSTTRLVEEVKRAGT